MANDQKTNYGIRIDILKLNGAFIRNFTGKTTTKQCIVIPVSDNPNIYIGEKSCNLNISAFELTNPKYDDTHILKADYPKEVREAMTQEQRDAMPILGNMRPIKAQQMTVTGTINMDAPEDEQQDDLPF